MSFLDAILAVARLKEEGIVAEYAIGGAMALVFWSEPVATYDLDVFVLEPQARTRKRLERVAALLEGDSIDRNRLDEVLARHGLSLPGDPP